MDSNYSKNFGFHLVNMVKVDLNLKKTMRKLFGSVKIVKKLVMVGKKLREL